MRPRYSKQMVQIGSIKIPAMVSRCPQRFTVRLSLAFSVIFTILGLSGCESEDLCWPFECSSTSADVSSSSTDGPAGSVSVTDVRSSLSLPSLAPTGTVWKPISEGNGKLVILTPASWSARSATIRNTDGSLVDTGTSCKRTNGNRCTYRFSRAGGGYPNPCVLRLGTIDYLINNPAVRIN